MCGIMGYDGGRTPLRDPSSTDSSAASEVPRVRLAGVAVDDGTDLTVTKAEGNLARLAAVLDEHPLAGTFGIGHTRWATHEFAQRPQRSSAHRSRW